LLTIDYHVPISLDAVISAAEKASLNNIGMNEFNKSRDSSVDLATGYGMDDRMMGVRFLAGAGNFSLHYRIKTGSGAHIDSYPVGIRGSFLGEKMPGCEADHSPPSSAEVKE
jgi:hypothetical protein